MSSEPSKGRSIVAFVVGVLVGLATPSVYWAVWRWNSQRIESLSVEDTENALSACGMNATALMDAKEENRAKRVECSDGRVFNSKNWNALTHRPMPIHGNALAIPPIADKPELIYSMGNAFDSRPWVFRPSCWEANTQKKLPLSACSEVLEKICSQHQHDNAYTTACDDTDKPPPPVSP